MVGEGREEESEKASTPPYWVTLRGPSKIPEFVLF